MPKVKKYKPDTDMNIGYTYQFIQGETTNTDAGTGTLIYYHPLAHTPIVAGTTTGTIYCLDIPIQTFIVRYDESFEFRDIGLVDIKAIGGELDLQTGVLKLEWNELPGDNFVRLNYEYELIYQEPKPKPKAKIPTSFIMPTFETFFTHEELQDISNNACTVCAWDFNTCLGDTIKEKYESLYVKLHELTNVLVKKGAKGYFWIVCSENISAIIETCTAGFMPSPIDCLDTYNTPLQGQYPLGMESIEYVGLLNGKWRIYRDSEMTYDSSLIIGCNDRREDPTHYGRMSIANLF